MTPPRPPQKPTCDYWSEWEREAFLKEIRLCIYEALDARDKEIYARIKVIADAQEEVSKQILTWTTAANTGRVISKVFWGIVLGLASITMNLFDIGKVTIQ